MKAIKAKKSDKNKYKKIISASDLNEYAVNGDDLSMTSGWVIRVRRRGARPEEAQYSDVDLNNIYMPSNDLFVNSTPLAQRPDLVAALFCAADAFIATRSKTEDLYRQVLAMIHTLILIFEALWIRGVVSIDAIRHEHFDDFSRDFSKGGWVKALMLERRLAGR